MEILLRLLGDTCHILPSILRYTPTFIDIVCVKVYRFCYIHYSESDFLVHFEGALLRTGAHPKDSKVTSFTAGFMVAYDSLWCSIPQILMDFPPPKS